MATAQLPSSSRRSRLTSNLSLLVRFWGDSDRLLVVARVLEPGDEVLFDYEVMPPAQMPVAAAALEAAAEAAAAAPPQKRQKQAAAAAAAVAPAAAAAAAALPPPAAPPAAAAVLTAPATVGGSKGRLETLEVEMMGVVSDGTFLARVSALERAMGIEPTAGAKLSARLSALEAA